MLDFERAKSWYPAGDATHGFSHIQRVYDLCEQLAREEGEGDLDILRAAALLHDVEGTAEGRGGHQLAAAEFARQILEEEGWEEDDIQAVEHCIRAHRFREQREPPRTLEAKILFDADKLDAIGAVGVIRALAFAVQQGTPVYHLPSRSFLAGNGREPGEPHTPYHEYHYKLRHLAGMLHTKAGKRLAQERHRVMAIFFRQLRRELDGAS